LCGVQIELDIDPEDKVSRGVQLTSYFPQGFQIKEKVKEQLGVSPEQQRLIFGGKRMYGSFPI